MSGSARAPTCSVSSGEVADEAFLAVMAGPDPRRPDRDLGRSYDDASVRGFDVTCSAPKSVSVLWALGDDLVRAHVVAAHDAAVAAVAGWIEAHAHTRFRIGGEVAVVDAEGVDRGGVPSAHQPRVDPQLHTHLVVANRVRSPDGRWLALDARSFKVDQRTLSALYHAGLRAELTGRLGVRWDQPRRGIAEMADVAEMVRVEFSQRSGMVDRRVDDKLDRFAETMGREPTARERWRLEREAVVDSRPAKPKPVAGGELHARWAAQVARLGLDPVEVVDAAVGRPVARHVIDRHAAARVVDQAMAALVGGPVDVAARRAGPGARRRRPHHHRPRRRPAGRRGWSELAGEVAVARCVDVSRPVPPGALLRRDGRPVTESAIDRALTTQAILDQEAAPAGAGPTAASPTPATRNRPPPPVHPAA